MGDGRYDVSPASEMKTLFPPEDGLQLSALFGGLPQLQKTASPKVTSPPRAACIND